MNANEDMRLWTSEATLALERTMKKSIAIALALFGSTLAANAATWNVFANMDMAQHGLTGPATAQMAGTYDDVTNIWTINSLTASDLTGDPTDSHVHLGTLGNTGPVIVPIGSDYSQAGNIHTYTGPMTLSVDEANEAAFLSQGAYINIHTGQFPSGEVRGQVFANPVPEPATMGILAIGLAGAALRKKRQRA